MATNNALAERSLLVNLTIKACSFRKLDKKVTTEVTTSKNASKDAARVNKALMARVHLKDISTASSALYNYHVQNTLAWSDSGGRILAASHYLEYVAEVNRLMEERKQAVDKFVQVYPELVDRQRVELGDMFNENEFPAISDLSRRFSSNISVLPLPTMNDFRISIQNDSRQEMWNEVEKQFQDSVKGAMHDAWSRLKEAVETVSTRLQDEDAIFRNSLFGNLCELCELLDKFNISGDPELTRIKNEVEEKLCNTDPDNIRHDKTLRSNIAKDAQDILDSMAGYC